MGTGVALVTPFTNDFKVDVEGLKRVVNFQVENGIDYLVVLGTTGESVTLTKNEKQLVIDTVIEVNKGRLPLVLGVGGNDTQAVINEVRTFLLLPQFCLFHLCTINLRKKEFISILRLFPMQALCLLFYIMCREERPVISFQKL